MPTYDFEDVETGEPVELFFHMSDSPKYGEVIEHEGRTLERVISRTQKGVVAKNVEFKCWQVSGEEAAGAKNYDSDGCPVFSSKKEVREFLAHQREIGSTNATYGDGWSGIKP